MDGKKISFSLNKIVKKPIIKPTFKKINDHELIECLEGQAIKIVGKDESQKPALLVIPLVQRTTTSKALMALQIIREEQGIEPEDIEKDSITNKNEESKNIILSHETLEQKATREILNGLNKEDVKNETKVFSLPLKPEDLPLDGAKEATLDDYENIPIQDFGMAMLRGMGYVEEPKKKNDKLSLLPVLRPKGMGLGADKMVKPKILIAPRNDEILEIKKNANIRILAGKFKDLYGQIEGLDDDSGRVIVKLAIGGNRESLNEFMVQPVSKQEYLKYAKVLNSVKYQEYKVKDEIKTTPENSVNTREGTSRIENDEKRFEEYKNNNKEIGNMNKTDDSHRNAQYISSDSTQEDEKQNISKTKKYHKDRRRSRTRSRSKHSNHRDPSSESSEYQIEKKKSHKSHKIKNKKNRNRSREERNHNSSDEEKYHKKKTKKSKKPRSRSKTRK